MADSTSPIRRRIWQIQSAYWERRLGVSTRGFTPAAVAESDQHDYSSLPYAAIFGALDALALQPDDVFMDLGSGKGRVVCCAARRKLRLVVGVEYSAELCQVARENLAHLRRRRSDVRIECQGAEQTDFDDVTVLYLYNPFGEDTLRAVLDRLRQSLDRRPREIRLAYVNPEHEALLEACAFLSRYRAWGRGEHSSTHHAASFWRNAD